jgi:hypothetical protein
MKSYKILISLIILTFNCFIFSENNITVNFLNISELSNLTVDTSDKDENYTNYLLEINAYSFMKKSDYYYNLDYYKYEKKQEFLLRRAEILFFGSLTFVTFGGWFFISVFNTLIYNDQFGKIRREQFLPLFLGSGTISIAVVFSDLFINIKPKLEEKNIEIY